jgi:hypothetical protein
VDLYVGFSGLACLFNIFWRHVLATFLNLFCNEEKPFQFLRTGGVPKVRRYTPNDLLVAVEVGRGNGSVRGLAVITIVE